MLHDQTTYTRHDTLRDMIRDNNRLLTVLHRFDISLGFGDATIERVCADNGVDTDTFLAVVNYLGGKQWEQYPISLMALMAYLRRSHEYFLEYLLPGIKKTLIEGIHEAKTSEVAMVILHFFDTYMEEVAEHMNYENSVIFTYIEGLLNGVLSDGFRISDFSTSHDHVAARLDDLKELFIYKYKQQNNERISLALLNLMNSGVELSQHCEIENLMLFPQVAQYEQELRTRCSHEATSKANDSADSELLTKRETEVLRWVANGLSAKEIADKMCLSVHTVNTYRKNISAKLNIHSVTGLAFYAVLHGIIDINDIQMP